MPAAVALSSVGVNLARAVRTGHRRGAGEPGRPLADLRPQRPLSSSR
ncbi:hypothetical protein ACPA9J_00930 [Pseudomonas aeruginosa]